MTELTGPEPIKPGITIEIKTGDQITDQDTAKFEKFVNQENDNYFLIANEETTESEELGLAAYVHSFAYSSLDTRRKQHQGLLVSLAKDGENVVGYSIAELDKDTNSVNNTYIGIGQKYQGQGIATQLLISRHEALKSKGINTYITNAREEVLKLYNKLGISYKYVPIEGSAAQTIGKRVQVDLTN